VREPGNHTGWVDNAGDTWVRVDDLPGHNSGTWYPICDGPGWELQARHTVGTSRTWDQMEEHGPWVPASPERTARAIELVRLEAVR
jgi:hypothetical protein